MQRVEPDVKPSSRRKSRQNVLPPALKGDSGLRPGGVPFAGRRTRLSDKLLSQGQVAIRYTSVILIGNIF